VGSGAFAIVLEVEHNGQKYAGKRIHDVLMDGEYGDDGNCIRRCEEECRLLSQLRHPNIVQFVGVYFRQGEQVPILVMELLPTNLRTCIEQHGILPKDIGYSILHDVALGLHYLHSQSPPIMHRDIDACNILLTSKMSAKIGDFGSARSVATNDIGLTQIPGNLVYMPPEAIEYKPRYDTSIDVFSYGVLMVFMFSGKLSIELKPPLCYSQDGSLRGRSEVERREEYLQAIGNDHPAMKLILQCISNFPRRRPTATEISQEIKRICQHDGKWSVHVVHITFNH
jgi:serine/threonine protein kinase